MPVVEDAADTTAAHNDDEAQQQQRHRIIMTELFVLAGGGTQPFWRNTTTVGTSTRIGTDTKEEEVDHPDTNTNTEIKSTRPWQFVRILVYCWMISVSTKVLLFPAYRSTDFDVHRHWKALTYYYRNDDDSNNNEDVFHNIPMVHWYADNTWIPTTTTTRSHKRSKSSPTPTPATSVQTVHTLDYPPGFALMEYIMVNHWIVHQWLFRDCHRRRRRSGSLSSSSIPPPDPCFDIMDDPTTTTTTTSTMNNHHHHYQNNDDRIITPKCRSYMRSTVLVVADTLYWCGAVLVVAAVTPGKHDHRGSDPPRFSSSQLVMVGVVSSLLLFVSLTFHPTLLWLDHVHFQYNGAMLGVLLGSIGWLLHGNNHHHHSIAKKKASFQYYEHIYHILAVVVFGLLLTLKHLYITNSLWYILYILRRYCMTTPTLPNDQLHSPSPRTTTRRLRLQWIRLSLVAICGSMAVAVPFIPFFIAIYYSDTRALSNATDATYLQKVQEWLTQLQHRLFPFQRGLVHTYWAGNVWAIYVAAYKVMTYLGRTMGIVRRIMGGEPWLPSPDTITPTVSAVAMLLAQTPGLYMAWWAAVHKCNIRLLQSFTIVSLGTFLFQYHAHEKAIVTSLLPCIVWYAMIRYQNEPTEKIRKAASIMFDMNAYSILGLYPLLYQSQELLLKVSSTTLYLSFLWLWCYSHCDSNGHSTNPKSPSVAKRSMPSTNWLTLLIVSTTIIQLEIPYRWLWGKYEFMPLALTSLVCAFGYISLFVRLICF